MIGFFSQVTEDLLFTIFNNPIFEVFSLTFLLAVGLSVFQIVKRSVT